jgi:hypothetical protein
MHLCLLEIPSASDGTPLSLRRWEVSQGVFSVTSRPRSDSFAPSEKVGAGPIIVGALKLANGLRRTFE